MATATVHATCFPDYNLHSNRDTIYNVDATQLRRIALIFAASGYFVATADASVTPRLVNEVAAGSLELLAKMQGIAARRALAEDRDSISVIRETWKYGASCVRSVSHFGKLPLIEAAAARVEAAGKLAEEQMVDSLRPSTASNSSSESEERQAAEMRPRWKASLADIVRGRPRVAQTEPRLSNALLFEVDSLIDGKRTALEIYRIAQAESWLGGSPYYGPVTLAQVVARIKALAAAGLVEVMR